MNVISWRALLVMNTFSNTICRKKTGPPIVTQSGYLNIGLTDKPFEVSWTVPMLYSIHLLYPLNWDLKLSELLWACLSNGEKVAGNLLFNHFHATVGDRKACSCSPASALDG